jgi:hypothetical protein
MDLVTIVICNDVLNVLSINMTFFLGEVKLLRDFTNSYT